MAETIRLQRSSEDVAWGFRLQGGVDYYSPLAVEKVTPGSVASKSLSPGDVIICIGDSNVEHLTRGQAMQLIKEGGHVLQLKVLKSNSKLLDTSPGLENEYSRLSITDNNSPYRNQVSVNNTNEMNDYVSYTDNSHNNTLSSVAPFSPPPIDNYNFGKKPQIPAYGSMQTGGYRTEPIGSPSVSPQKSTFHQPVMPDAVMNMAAKGDSTKKPFSYISDVSDIQQQRDKVRRRAPAKALPKYQNMLNLPHFEDSPGTGIAHRTFPPTSEMYHDKTPNSPGSEPGIAHLQYNSPFNLYSGDNVVETLQGQTGGFVKDVIGLPKKEKADIKESAVYKMIHGIDQPQRARRQKSQEMNMSYVEKQNEAEEKSSEIDTSSIRPLLFDDAQNTGYDQQSIRYTGKHIPSRSFRLLQSMTGAYEDDISKMQGEKSARRMNRNPASSAGVEHSVNSADDRIKQENLNKQTTASEVLMSGNVYNGPAVRKITLRQQSQTSSDDVLATDF